MWVFFSRRSKAANSAVHDRILAEFQTNPYTYGFPNYLQESRRSDKKKKALEIENIFSIISLWGFFQTIKGSLLPSPWSDLDDFPNSSKIL